MNKVEVFSKELSYIKNKNYIESAKKMIELLPDYFFSIPASSTGKYHPEFAQGDGGLVRHTKVAVRMCYELTNNNSIGYSFTSDEKDLMMIALIMHDGCKSGCRGVFWGVFITAHSGFFAGGYDFYGYAGKYHRRNAVFPFPWGSGDKV